MEYVRNKTGSDWEWTWFPVECSGLLHAELISLPQVMSYDPFLCIYILVPSFHPAKERHLCSRH